MQTSGQEFRKDELSVGYRTKCTHRVPFGVHQTFPCAYCLDMTYFLSALMPVERYNCMKIKFVREIGTYFLVDLNTRIHRIVHSTRDLVDKGTTPTLVRQ